MRLGLRSASRASLWPCLTYLALSSAESMGLLRRSKPMVVHFSILIITSLMISNLFLRFLK